jgi:hypothetical protein
MAVLTCSSGLRVGQPASWAARQGWAAFKCKCVRCLTRNRCSFRAGSGCSPPTQNEYERLVYPVCAW